ncbi:response regulator [Nocardioides marmorisolisilvae]|uniref:DNA-binding response regulator n=1 Tax=Nocardioides marmorisolisilvae TaxID=1542737 RepID=A0A3N0DX44_9ACTN|nr:response regulator transcription factor [Nocardioides marmorisolisilvae]RNL80192.1 DNA-binding response regulator [Nocardioides marmorisolisilvae]
MIRTLLVDDHALFRRGVRALLATMPDVEVVGEADSGPAAVDEARSLQPDLVLLDLQMPGGGGLDAIPAILNESPSSSILVVTMREDSTALRQALVLGARGYVLKDTDGENFIQAVSTVGLGDAYIGRELAVQLAGLLQAPTPSSAFPELTERERTILQLMARGEANADIARSLHLTTKSVQNYVSRIFAKLDVADRSRAIVIAREAGLHVE